VTGRRKEKVRCEEFKNRIDAYLEKELRKDESMKFEDHLRSCRNCRMEIESIQKSIAMMKTIFSDKKPPPEIKKKVFDKG
jgi:predicted anti-sigma-YlaC factor YlaD